MQSSQSEPGHLAAAIKASRTTGEPPPQPTVHPELAKLLTPGSTVTKVTLAPAETETPEKE
jgi:hypothetical protein